MLHPKEESMEDPREQDETRRWSAWCVDCDALAVDACELAAHDTRGLRGWRRRLAGPQLEALGQQEEGLGVVLSLLREVLGSALADLHLRGQLQDRVRVCAEALREGREPWGHLLEEAERILLSREELQQDVRLLETQRLVSLSTEDWKAEELRLHEEPLLRFGLLILRRRGLLKQQRTQQLPEVPMDQGGASGLTSFCQIIPGTPGNHVEDFSARFVPDFLENQMLDYAVLRLGKRPTMSQFEMKAIFCGNCGVFICDARGVMEKRDKACMALKLSRYRLKPLPVSVIRHLDVKYDLAAILFCCGAILFDEYKNLMSTKILLPAGDDIYLPEPDLVELIQNESADTQHLKSGVPCPLCLEKPFRRETLKRLNNIVNHFASEHFTFRKGEEALASERVEFLENVKSALFNNRIIMPAGFVVQLLKDLHEDIIQETLAALRALQVVIFVDNLNFIEEITTTIPKNVNGIPYPGLALPIEELDSSLDEDVLPCLCT